MSDFSVLKKGHNVRSKSLHRIRKKNQPMMQKIILFVTLLFVTVTSNAQQKTTAKANQFADLAITFGSSQASVAGSYVCNWKFGFGKKRNLEAGLGARLTNTFGSKLDYTTAGPAKFTRTSTTPFLIVFAGQKTENWDTLKVQRPYTSALNVSANFGYNFTPKLSAGFNIDLIGFTLGRKSSVIYTSNGVTRTEPVAKPTAFNVLLTGDHDYGTLNSEFFMRYRLNDKWSVRGIYQFIFTEYNTTNIKQALPDGSSTDRFRNKANNLGGGITLHF